MPGIGDDERWFDEAAGPLVRPYVHTGGRIVPTHAYELTTLVLASVSAESIEHKHHLSPEHIQIVRHCQTPQAVVEIAQRLDPRAASFGEAAPAPHEGGIRTDKVIDDELAAYEGLDALGLPIRIVCVMIDDLRARGFVEVDEPVPVSDFDPSLYEAVIEGLRKL